MREHADCGRRALLCALATASTTSVAGCGYRGAPGDRLWERRVPETDRFGNPGATYLVDDVVLVVDRNTIGVEDGRFTTTVHRYGLDGGEERGSVDLPAQSSFEIPGRDAVLFVFEEREDAPEDAAVVTASGRLRTLSVPREVMVAAAGPDGLYVVSPANELSGPTGAGDDRFETALPAARDQSTTYARVAVSDAGCAVAVLGTDGRMHVQAFSLDGDRRWATDRSAPSSGLAWGHSRSFRLALVDDAVVLVGPDVVVFDADAGSVRATAKGSTRPAALRVGEDAVYVGAGSTVHAFDRESWSKRWSYTIERGRQWRRDDDRSDWGRDVPDGFGDRGGGGQHLGAGPRVAPVPDGVVFEVDDAVTELAADGSVRWKRRFRGERLLGAQADAVVFRTPDGLVARRR